MDISYHKLACPMTLYHTYADYEVIGKEYDLRRNERRLVLECVGLGMYGTERMIVDEEEYRKYHDGDILNLKIYSCDQKTWYLTQSEAISSTQTAPKASIEDIL